MRGQEKDNDSSVHDCSFKLETDHAGSCLLIFDSIFDYAGSLSFGWSEGVKHAHRSLDAEADGERIRYACRPV